MCKRHGTGDRMTPDWMTKTRDIMGSVAIPITAVFFARMPASLNSVRAMIALVSVGVSWAAFKTSQA